jgi:hypothetical protein
MSYGKKVSRFFTFSSFRSQKGRKSGRFYFFSSFKKLEKMQVSFTLFFLSSYFFNTEDSKRTQKTKNSGRQCIQSHLISIFSLLQSILVKFRRLPQHLLTALSMETSTQPIMTTTMTTLCRCHCGTG